MSLKNKKYNKGKLLIKKHSCLDYLVAFLLLSPQLSLPFLSFVDGYFLLFFLLIFHTLYSKKINVKIVISIFFVLISFILILLFQHLFLEKGKLIYANLIEGEGRIMDTYGYYIIGQKSAFNSTTFSIFPKLGLAFLLMIYVSHKKLQELINFLQKIILVGVIYQLFWYGMFFLNLTPIVNSTFFSSNIMGYKTAESIFIRNGFPRFSFGFSEPSFGACYMIVSFGALSYLLKNYYVGFMRKLKYIIFSTILIISTMSTSMILIILFLLGILKVLSRKIISYILCFILILGHLAFLILKTPYFTENYPSVSFRLLKIADISSIGIDTSLWGIGLGMVYTQPPLYSLYIQMGIVWIIIYSIFLRYYFSIKSFFILLFLVIMITVSSFYIAYLLISFFLLLSISFVDSQNIKKTKV